MATRNSSILKGGRQINWAAVSNFSDITPKVKQHLVKVYVSLAAMLGLSAIGAATHLVYNVGGLMTVLACLGLIVLMGITPHRPDTLASRTLFLFGIAFFQGCSIGPLIAYVLEVDPSIIVTAFAGTVCIFACFTGSALLAERRSMMFLGGLLSSGLSLLCFLGLVNLFVGSMGLYNLHLYLGLLLFCGFVMFDTQLIVEKASAGSDDYLWHALDLFLDFVNIFVKLVSILTKNKKSKK